MSGLGGAKKQNHPIFRAENVALNVTDDVH